MEHWKSILLCALNVHYFVRFCTCYEMCFFLFKINKHTVIIWVHNLICTLAYGLGLVVFGLDLKKFLGLARLWLRFRLYTPWPRPRYH